MYTLDPVGTLSIKVGPSQNPPGAPSGTTPRPSTTILAPSFSAISIYEATLSRWTLVTSGPISQLLLPSPTLICDMRSVILAISSSATGSTATTTEIAMQRSPAEPKPAFTAESATRSRSASGKTSMWFLAPPSAWTRLPFLEEVS